MFFAEQNSLPIEKMPKDEDNELINDDRKIKETLSLTDDVNLIIMHRSLYIIKKKFEKYKTEIKDIYIKYSEEESDDLIVDIEKMQNVIQEIGTLGKFDIKKMENFKAIAQEEMKFITKCFEDNELMSQLINFIKKERRKYNKIFKDKKIKKNFTLDDYKNYIPEGEDELTRKYTEVIKEEEDNELNQVEEEKKEEDSKSIKEENEEANNNNNTNTNNHNNTNTNNDDDNNNNNNTNTNIDNNDNFVPEQTKFEDIVNHSSKETQNIIIKDDLNKSLAEDAKEGESQKHNELLNTSKIRTKKRRKRNDIPIEYSISSHQDNNYELSTGREENNYQYENYDPNIRVYTKSYIYIETLPLIIADFLTFEPFFSILDYSDDLRDNLRALFDNEILERLGEQAINEVNIFKTEQLRDLLLNQTKIAQNIKNYEDLFKKRKADNNNITFIKNALDKLKLTKTWLDLKIAALQNDTNTYNEYETALAIQRGQRENMKQQPSINEKEKSIINQSNNIKENINNTNNNININDNDNSKNIPVIQPEKTPSKKNEIKIDEIKPIEQSEIQKQNITLPLSNIDQNESQIPSAILSDYQSENTSKIKSRKTMSKEEKREIALSEIFHFYSRQHTLLGHKSTFDSIQDKLSHLNLSEYSKFCVEFKILITKQKLVEIFIKTASNTKNMSLNEFKKALQKIAIALNEEKIRNLKKKIRNLRKSTVNHNLGTLVLVRKEQIDEEIEKCQIESEMLSGRTNEQLIEELYQYIEIDNENNYRNKMKGFNLPFNNVKSNGKVIKLPKINVYGKVKKLDLKTAKEIRMMIEQRKFETEKEKKKMIRVKGMEREHQKKIIEQKNNIMYPSYPSQRQSKPKEKGQKKIFLNKENNNQNYIEENSKMLRDLMGNKDQNNSIFFLPKAEKKIKLTQFGNQLPPLNQEQQKENKFTWNAIERMDINDFDKEQNLLNLL